MSSVTLAYQMRVLGEMYMLYAGIVNLTLGILGNISIVLVLTTVRAFKGNQSAFYLTTESIVNIGLLLAIYLTRILTYILGYDPVFISLNSCKIRAMIIQIFGVCSLFTVCFLSFDQYLSTHLQYYRRQMSTLKLAHRLTVFIVVFAMLHSTIFFIFTEYHVSMECTVYNPIVKHYFSFAYYPILTSVLLLIIMVATSLLEFNVDSNGENYMELAIVYLVSSILYSLVYTNFAINFFVFFVVSSRFRRQAKGVLLKGCRVIKCQCERERIHRNQISPEVPPHINSDYELE